MTLSHPVPLAIGVLFCVIAALALRRRRASLHRARGPHWLIVAGMLLLAAAAGGVAVVLHPARRITAMVDLSPSTRGATYRDRAALLHRISEMVGNVPVRLIAFSDHAEPLPDTDALPDLPCDQTHYAPPDADAVLLFSDGEFALPVSGAPTYPVIDAGLIDPPDAAVTEMHFDGATPVASVRNSGKRRELIWKGYDQRFESNAINASAVVRGNEPANHPIAVTFNPGDRWRENDALSLPALVPPTFKQWWVGAGPPPAGWITLDPIALPADPADYLSVAAIALSNIPATDLPEAQQQRLTQYVRDLGGTLLIFGGDQAFAAGGYGGTQLDALSPLASDPPSPTRHWMLLADSSGSMAESLAGNATESRWSAAVNAMLRLLPSLPAVDVVSVGSFARDLSWWTDDVPASTAVRSTTLPQGVGPSGPTNLEPVLSQIARRRDQLPGELLLLTDADTTIDDPQALAAALKAADVHVSLLALDAVSPNNPVVQIVNETAGRWITSDPSRWAQSLQWLMRSAAPALFEKTTLPLQFDRSLALPARTTTAWNRTWIKANAAERTTAMAAGKPVSLGASWRLGIGTVAAFAFAPTADETAAISQAIESPPRDPRFKVSWQCADQINVAIDAIRGKDFQNGLSFELKIADQSPRPLAQIGPGQYALKVPAMRLPALATLQLDGHVIDRQAIPGRYAPEFDKIGNDDAALAALAARTMGQVISPSQHTRIVLSWPSRVVNIDQFLLAAGGLLVAAGVILLRSH